MNETRPKEQGILHWLTWNWHRALIGLAIGVFVVDLIGPEILAKPFLCGRAENGKHIYITLPESSLGANWQEAWKTQPYKECELKAGWDTCYWDGPNYIVKKRMNHHSVFWSVIQQRSQIESLSGTVMASDILYFVKPAWLPTLIFPEYGGGTLCKEMSEKYYDSFYGLSFVDVVQKGK